MLYTQQLTSYDCSNYINQSGHKCNSCGIVNSDAQKADTKNVQTHIQNYLKAYDIYRSL